MATTVDSEQVRPQFERPTAELQPRNGLRSVAAAPDAAAQAPSPSRTRSATQMRNAAVHPKGLIWASAVGTLRRSSN